MRNIIKLFVLFLDLPILEEEWKKALDSLPLEEDSPLTQIIQTVISASFPNELRFNSNCLFTSVEAGTSDLKIYTAQAYVRLAIANV